MPLHSQSATERNCSTSSPIGNRWRRQIQRIVALTASVRSHRLVEVLLKSDAVEVLGVGEWGDRDGCNRSRRAVRFLDIDGRG